MSASTIRRLLLTRNLHIPSCKPILPAPLDKQPRTPIADYSSIPLQQLRRELYHRSLPTKGAKEYVIYCLKQHDKKHGRTPSICTSPRIIKGKVSLKAKKRLEREAAAIKKNAYLEAKASAEIKQTAYCHAHLPSPPITHLSTAPAPSAFASSVSAFRIQRVPTVPTKRGYATTTTAPIPPIIPKPWQFALSEEAKPAIRVPFLPDNEFSRYHRKEFVPDVAPPHRPAVSAVDDDVSDIAATSSLSHTMEGVQGTFGDGGVLDEVLVGLAKESEGESECTIAPREDDVGPEFTEEKKTLVKLFAVGAVSWWVFGEGAMRLLGIL